MSKHDPCRFKSTRCALEVLEPRLLFTAVPVVTELLASNGGSLLDEDGDSSDWLEIYNAGDSALDLEGWFLTDAADELTQWAFPAVSLDPGAYLVVFASGKDRADADGTELHTSFSLGAGGEYLALVEGDGSTVAFEFTPQFPAQQADVSYGFTFSTTQSQVLVDAATPLSYLRPTNGSLGTSWTQVGFNDSAWTTGASGIGYENNPGQDSSFDSLLGTTLPSGTTSVYTRYEFTLGDASLFNELTLRAMYDDGFVAYLNGTLLESRNAPLQPAYNAAATSGRGDDTVLAGFVSFEINNHLGALQDGLNVLAIHALNQSSSSDMLLIPELIAQSSNVDLDDAGYFATPTPGADNGESFDGFVGDTAFSVDRGFYDSPFSLTITTPDTPDALIVYTTDGSAPAVDSTLNITNGTAYTGAITISSTTNIRAAGFKLGFEPTNIDSQTYIFLDDVAQQTAASQRAALEQGLPGGSGNGVDFGLDSEILNSVSAQAFRDSLLSVPTISLTLDNASFLGSNGIYSNPGQTGSASEREVSVEWFTPEGAEAFQVDAGVRIQGAASRSLAEKYSFRLAFRGEYGDPELVYPFFGDGVDEFDTIVLRSVFNDGYGWRGDDNNLREQLYVRDLWFRESQLAMGQPAARGNWAHLYINGQYWGLYHPSERPDANYAGETLGGDSDHYDAINHGGVIDDASENLPNDNTSANQIYATALSLAQAVNTATGSAAKWAAYQRLQGNFANGQDDPNHEDFLDVENYIDYIILNFFGGNDDWPNNNWFTNRLRGAESEGFRFFAWDSEISLGLSTRTDVFEDYTGVSGGAAELYAILRNYEEFRVQFSDRVQMHLFNGGALSGDLPAERFESLALVIRDAILGESARWGDQHFSNNPLTQAEWDNALGDMLSEYFVQRPGIVLSHFVSAGLYASVSPVSWNQRGGVVSPGFEIVLSAPQGVIYYTTDGSDPRQVGGGVGSNATLYTGAISLSTAGTIRARVLHNGQWSALDQADFTSTVATAAQMHLRITELHYNPTGPTPSEVSAGYTDDDLFEFIELRNTGSAALDLDGVHFDTGVGGVAFSFDTGGSLAGGERGVLVRDIAAFQARYGTGVNILGVFDGSLSNGGERLRLNDAFGSVILDFTYEDGGDPGEEDWPSAADGDGPSLVVVNTEGDYNDGSNWVASSTHGGTPGVGESAGIVGDITGDGYVGADDLDALLALWGDDAASNPQAGAADLDASGSVGGGDLAIVIANWGSGTPAAAPTSHPDAAPGAGGGNNEGPGHADKPPGHDAGPDNPETRPAMRPGDDAVPRRKPGSEPAVPTRRGGDALAAPAAASLSLAAAARSLPPKIDPVSSKPRLDRSADVLRAASNRPAADALALTRPIDRVAQDPAAVAEPTPPRRFGAMVLKQD